MGTRRSTLGPADAGRERIVTGGFREASAQRFGVGPGVDGSGDLAQRGRDAAARAHHAGVRDQLGDRDTQACRRRGVP